MGKLSWSTSWCSCIASNNGLLWLYYASHLSNECRTSSYLATSTFFTYSFFSCHSTSSSCLNLESSCTTSQVNHHPSVSSPSKPCPFLQIVYFVLFIMPAYMCTNMNVYVCVCLQLLLWIHMACCWSDGNSPWW